MHRALTGVAIACAFSAAAIGQPSNTDLHVAIFRPDLSIVTETVKVDLPAGRSALRLDFVRGNADLTTLQVFPLDHAGDVAIVGQVRKNELPNTVFLDVDAKSALAERFELRYAARGYAAAPSYVATYDAATRLLSFSEDLEVSNDSGEPLDGARVDALFGDVRTVGSAPVMNGRTAEPPGAAPNAEPGLPSQPLVKDLAEHVVVSFGDRVALKDGVATRHRILDASGVATDIEYRFRADEAGGRVTRRAKVKNTPEAGLKGVSLQPGRVTLAERDEKGTERFLGFVDIGPLAPGGELELPLSVADDLFVERDRLDFKRYDLVFGEYNRALVSFSEDEQWRLKVRNHSSEARTLVVHEGIGGTDTFEIVESTSPAAKKDRNLVEFKVDVPAKGEAVLTYRVKKTNLKAG